MYASAADDLLILPHYEESEARRVEQSLTALHNEVHERSTNLASIITQAEQQQLEFDHHQVIQIYQP